MSRKYAWAAAAVAFGVLGFYLRWLNAHADLNSPSVDENDVVQQAVAFMGGEWKYYLPEYGALPMYCLALLYRVVAVLRGQTALEYAGRVFFDGAEQYLLARLFCAACYVPLAIASYRYLAPRFGRSAGLVSALLLSLPCLDRLTKATVRIDVPQGACQLAALLFLAKTLEAKSWRNWLAAGVFAGLGMACKPMPGALLAPCFWAASWFAATLELPVVTSSVASRLRSVLLRLWRSLSRPALWASGATALAAAVLANPTALDLREFIAGQLKASAYYSGPNAPGVRRTAFGALTLDPPLLIAIGLSVLAMPFLRDARARLIALFPLVYATAFWGRPVRTYYMVSPAMALCLVVGIAVGTALCRLGLDARSPGSTRPELAPQPDPGAAAPSARAQALGVALSLALVLGLSWLPLQVLNDFRRTISPQTLAREWIQENIPSGTRLFQFGTFAGGPRLVAASWAQERKFADFFDYGREHYDFYERAARQAYDEYRAQGRPYYDIDMFGAVPEPAERTRGWLAKSLAKRARKDGQEYIILASYRGTANYHQLGYSWIDSVELAREFGNVAIFHVPTVAPPSATAEGSGG